MSDFTSRDEPPRWWKIVAGVLVVGFAIAVGWFVNWRSAPPLPVGAAESSMPSGSSGQAK